MKGKPRDITDLTRGNYRRIYAGYVDGKRINAVSVAAEAWFWRVHTLADDFGNLVADTAVIFNRTVGRRVAKVRPAEVDKWVGEMVRAGLLKAYAVDGENYFHVVGFGQMQPAARSGRRVQRVPKSPYDDVLCPTPQKTGESEDCEESGGVRGNPEESGGIRCVLRVQQEQEHKQEQDQEHNNPPSEGSSEAASQPSPAPPPFLIFETVGGKTSGAKTWALDEAYVAELAEQFPGVDVRAESRRALGWTRDTRANRKTAGGMRGFLRRWMAREQNRSGGRSGGRAAPPAAGESEIPGTREPTAADWAAMDIDLGGTT